LRGSKRVWSAIVAVTAGHRLPRSPRSLSDARDGLGLLCEFMLMSYGSSRRPVSKRAAAQRAGVFPALYRFMNWTTWVAVLVVWPLVGLGVAYLIGCCIRGVESQENK
jgi:hypothetical protein